MLTKGLNSGLDDTGLMARKSIVDEARFDITAMIDLVFMMNIYFLVTMVSVSMQEINLPAARHVLPVDPDTAVILTVLEDGDAGAAAVYLGDGRAGQPLAGAEEQQERIRAYVEDAARQQKTTVLIKAEKNVRLRDIGRIGTATSGVAGMELRLAVLEKE